MYIGVGDEPPASAVVHTHTVTMALLCVRDETLIPSHGFGTTIRFVGRESAADETRRRCSRRGPKRVQVPNTFLTFRFLYLYYV